MPAETNEQITRSSALISATTESSRLKGRLSSIFRNLIRILRKYLTFVGPGFIIAVSYIDPGNYSTDVAAGALFQYKMLFILLLSNAFAIFLQSLSCKLGCVTGYNLPELCRAQFPFWLNILLYVFFEVAILATDLAEVIGTAIALNILFKIPLVAGVAITMIDVLIVLCAWKPDGAMRATRYFEIGVAILVAMVVCCFIALLTKISDIEVKTVLKGYLPNSTAFSKSGIYTSLSIMGAVVMPHSLILGTGLTQPRMMDWDVQHGVYTEDLYEQDSSLCTKYIPSLGAVRHTLSYSIVELTLSLMTFALFVNSAILIVSGATLFGVSGAADADLFGIHDLLSTILSPAAGTLFAVALLASGQSAGIVTTMAGQLVSEGFFKWTIRPWLRRLITRSIAVLPCIIVAGLVGRSGLAQVLNASQVALSILLPFITFPIILFTSKQHIMKVATNARAIATSEIQHDHVPVQNENTNHSFAQQHEVNEVPQFMDMSNSRLITTLAWMIWLTIAGLNTYLIVILAQTHGTGT
ncbi:Transporter protein smf2 [Taphrina deformans PYCC 5710]|uniref:Transporter protein smf2 n=1 Tax=Taphrina deformans (strain PYCC 5710 / ATCC 11124 / CBS 356.35 / IMI 108563 / JCM 9778 / NBRC 8474) TaxID=1097556 RepID=R4X701_TAPDE|nr:Transporter protein smf2 [Taphrina deformans PYCC 5710]|eukprot:CCG81022.1 Transporter protein smf2 [Taphrina deformans PYCC 5710]